jgi:hypothetical protein
MSKHKNKQRGGAANHPPIGPREHLLERESGVDIYDEGKTPIQHKGEVRTDQTHGHHGGSQRQTQNRGRG